VAGGGKRATDAPEEERQRPRPEAITRLAQRPFARAQRGRVRPEPAQAQDELPEDVNEAVPGVQIHRDAAEDRHESGQLAGPPPRPPALRQDGFDRCGWDDAGEHVEREMRPHRVTLGDLAYHQGHALLLPAYWLRAPPVSPTEQRITLSKRYCF